MAKTKVLITVKTYPTISGKYDELVCTAGFLEDGSWIRIYPVPFRKIAYDQQYKKYDWIEIDLVKNNKDFRPESYRPYSIESEFNKIGEIKADGKSWEERRKYCLKKVYTDFDLLISEAKDKNICTSLAVFKPKKIIDFYAEQVEREWDKNKLEKIISSRNQMNLFEENLKEDLNLVKKLPYRFKFKFTDINDKERNLMIEDWETGQLYWKCLAIHEGDETKAIESVKQKYFENFAKTKDLHFYVGTLYENHAKNYPNPFAIIGTFHPKVETQLSLF